MRFEGLIGGSYEHRAYTADQEYTVNWYPEGLQSEAATSKRILLPTPGVATIVSVPTDSPGRAHFALGGREFGVLGAYFYEFGRSGNILTSTTRYGAMFLTGGPSDGTNGISPNTSQPATISSNGDAGGELFITSGGQGYIFNLDTGALTKITALEDKAHFGGHLDGYFLALDTNTSTLYVSELYDGLTWNTGTMFAQRSLGPDNWRSMKVVGRAVWLFGEQTTEVWYNTGDRFPLSPLANQVIDHGIAAPWSAETLGGDIYWLSLNRDGKVCVAKASGMSPEIVSTYPLEAQMQSYLSINSAIADSYSDIGHSFYMLNFDADARTHVFDSTTGLWHDRGTWIPEENRFVAWRPRFYAYAFGEHRMLDASNGNLYRMSSDLVRDVDGRLIRRLRRAPAISNENRRIFYSELELVMDLGVRDDTGQISFVMQPQVAKFVGTATFEDEPVPGVEVCIVVDAVEIACTTTDENGEYEIPNVPNGEIEVTFTGENGCQIICTTVTVPYLPWITSYGNWPPDVVVDGVLEDCGGCGTSFTWTKAAEDGTVYFTDTSDGTPSTWAWTFENGTPATEVDQNPSSSFDLTGDLDLDHTFEVTLEVDGGPEVATATLVINFNDPASGVGD